MGREAVVTVEVAGVVGVRADHRDAAQRGRVERQRAVVAEQHEAAAGEVGGEVGGRGGADRRGHGTRRVVDVRSLEETELELREQHPGRRRGRRTSSGDLPVLDRRDQRGAVAVGGRQLDVDAGAERDRRRLTGVGREVVVVLELTDREVVGHDATVETPLVAEDPGQQVGVRRARHAVELLVRVHHRPHPGVPHGRFERVEVAPRAARAAG